MMQAPHSGTSNNFVFSTSDTQCNAFSSWPKFWRQSNLYKIFPCVNFMISHKFYGQHAKLFTAAVPQWTVLKSICWEFCLAIICELPFSCYRPTGKQQKTTIHLILSHVTTTGRILPPLSAAESSNAWTIWELNTESLLQGWGKTSWRILDFHFRIYSHVMHVLRFHYFIKRTVWLTVHPYESIDYPKSNCPRKLCYQITKINSNHSSHLLTFHHRCSLWVLQIHAKVT